MDAAASTPTPPIRPEALPIPMAVLDGDLRVAETNRRFDELVSQAGGKVRGRDLIELLTAAAAGVERVAGAQVFHLRSDLEDRWVRIDLQRHQGAVLALLTDVSAERRAIDALRFADRTREKLMRDADVGFWRYDPEQAVYAIDVAQEDDDRQSVIDLDDVVAMLLPDDRTPTAEIRERLTTEGGSAEHELRRRNRDGSLAYVRMLYRSGRRTASGRFEMYGLSQNVTALAKARDEAKAAARRLQLALNAANAGALEYDFDARKLWLSPELRAIVDEDALTDSEADATNMYHPDDRDVLHAIAAQIRAGASGGGADVRLLARDGPRWMRLALEAHESEPGQGRRATGLLIDIDAQKRQELALAEARRAAEAATHAKSQFLASVSHEIRTPMNGIVAVLNLLKREKISAEGLHLLNEALACSRMLGQLIDDVLDFSKIEAGRLDLSPEPCDPVDIARSVTALLRPQADAKRLDLSLEAPPGMGGASLDPMRLRQCLFNIIGNAVKFTNTGGVAVRLAYVGDGPARRLRCEVQDTGIGVPEAARETLFDRFQQAEGGTTRKFGGTGLGLAISRSLARMMGGDMDFTSVEGEGSTFWFEVAAPAAEAPDVEAECVFLDSPLSGLRALVVDDNATNRLVAVKSLQALGAEAEAVESGEAAIAAAPDGAYDLILMDINMPHMDGLEATRRIRALACPAAATPVIALTADVMSHHRAAYEAAGLSGVVCKPFSPAQLLSEIARLADQGEEAVAASA